MTKMADDRESTHLGIQYPHDEGRKQGWSNLDSDLREFVTTVASELTTLLKPAGFVGAYLHGSLAMNSFYRPKSDLDILFVVKNPLAAEARKSVALALCDLSDVRPLIGDLEVSVLTLDNTRTFRHPMSFEMHYSETHKDAIRAGSLPFTSDANVDIDLSAHLTVLRQRGICLSGESIENVFAQVPLKSFQNAILDDLEWILTGEHIVETPFYCVLNCCRVLAMNENGWDKVLSKDEGGEWGLANIPDPHRSIVEQALACYRSPDSVSQEHRRTDGHQWDHKALLSFRDCVAQRISNLITR